MKLRRLYAFTLVELMVALSVTSLLVVLMLRIFESGSAAWQLNDEKLDTFREARAALQIMARDFSTLSAVPSAPEKFPVLTLDWHQDTPPEDQVNQEIYGLLAARNKVIDKNGVATDGPSDWCAVGYFCAWDEKKHAFVLKRQFAESRTTFDRLAASAALTDPRAIFDAVFVRTPQSTDALASYVWDLHVDIPDPTDASKMVPWTTAPGSFNRNLPPWVEIRFRALGMNAARKMERIAATRDMWFASGKSDDNAGTFYERYVLPGEQQFVTRVKLCQ